MSPFLRDRTAAGIFASVHRVKCDFHANRENKTQFKFPYFELNLIGVNDDVMRGLANYMCHPLFTVPSDLLTSWEQFSLGV